MSDDAPLFSFTVGPIDPKMVKRAVALIKPQSDKRHACISAVEDTIGEFTGTFEDYEGAIHPRTKLGKRAADRLSLAINRIIAAMRNEHLDKRLRIDTTELAKLAERCAAAAKKPSGKLPRKKAELKRHGVMFAESLMRDYAAPNEAFDATKGSRFCRLAALLAGMPNADLHNQCQAYVREYGVARYALEASGFKMTAQGPRKKRGSK